ncbi:MAG: hypothetical protein MI974_09055, partial [Chitinophagales bacterium]|nr:hypothetical protein [Chitinophagales bacterium]
MKKITLPILSFLFIALSIQAQEVPSAFKYQTVIRDAAGEILGNQAVRIGIDINQNNTPIYSEDHEVTTNAYGLVSLEIGRGIIVGGVWENIDWSFPTSLRILLDPTGGNNLEVIGSSELLSVPYALQAGNAGGSSSWSEEGDNISNNNSGNVGIGTTTPDRKLSVSTNAATDGVMTVNNESAEGFAGTYFNSEGGLKGYVGYVGSGNWVEPNSFQLGGFNSDIKFLTTNQYATAPMTISNANQSVGIGTNAPDRKLSVSTNAAADGVMTVNNESAEGFAGTYFNSEGGLKGYVGYVGSGNWVEPNSFQLGGFNSDIKFLTTNQYATAPMT